MTSEERFERIEHVTAGLAEERRKDREEFRAIWRDTQRHIDEVAVNLSKLTVQVAEMDDRLGARIETLAEESRAADRRSQERDQRLGERIETLVSAMGEFIASQARS
jgi:ABC-type transporter Mla subunit MlaD